MVEPITKDTPLCWTDTETAGLDDRNHGIWEVGLLTFDQAIRWFLPINVEWADPNGLAIGRFHERHPQGNARVSQPGPAMAVTSFHQFASEYTTLTHGLHLAGACVSFDEERLRKLLRAHGFIPSWHYHILDTTTYAAGKLGLLPPYKSEDVSREFGIDPDRYDRHTALGDCYWARDLFNAVRARG